MTHGATPAKVAEAGPVTAITLTNGHFPRGHGPGFPLSSTAGFPRAVVFSAEFADSTIGDPLVGTLLGHNAEVTPSWRCSPAVGCVPLPRH
ncbi:hypothetical protein [Saccharothrix sp. ALI-22-I]|uniref:hypothetical protein n=1 Tax=Saccharothrix sp. ALI-22-I TaxID=1933778 RepID=UPI0009FEFFE1|nr:hypothetical protein [Saccharothrix sp. ALI-22-I]